MPKSWHLSKSAFRISVTYSYFLAILKVELVDTSFPKHCGNMLWVLVR